MKKSDLYKKWGWVLEICEGTEVNPRSAWKFKGYVQDDKLPNFEYDNPECFEFLVTILDDKPVFVGDKIYANNCTSPLVVEGISKQKGYIFVGNCTNYDISILSWNPPKKTFFLNGVELPCPDGNKGGYQIGMFSERYYFTDFHDAQKVANAINKLLQDATK